jgi:hypothetical protein
MLFKLMKHDFRYSAKLFFALGAIAIALAAILGAAQNVQMSVHNLQIYPGWETGFFFPLMTMPMFSNLLIFPVGVAAIIHIAQFYRKSMFGKVGHLSMTAPVSRGALLASKITVSFVWFLYVIAVGLAMVIIFSFLSPSRPSSLGWIIGSVFNADIAALVINVSVIAFAAIALLFFCITLSHSVFAGVRLHGIITGVIGLVYTWLYTWAAVGLTSRFMQVTHHSPAWMMSTPLTGLRYGRIVIDRMVLNLNNEITVFNYIYIDIFFIAFTLAATAIAIFATRALLENRVSL